MKFSLFKNGIKQTIPYKEIDLEEFIEILKEKNPLIDEIRVVETKDERDKIKSKLSYVTFGGTFTKRNNVSLKKSSGFACFDVDDIENLEEIKEEIKQNKYTHFLFVSPSGKGFKFLVKIPEVKSNEEYKQYWISIEKHYGLKDNDTGTKDISRACYVSYDSEPYLNPNSEIYTDKIEDTQQKIEYEGEKEKDDSRSGLEYRRAIAEFRKGKTREDVYKILMAYKKFADSSEHYREHQLNNAESFVLGEQERGEAKENIEQFLAIKYDEEGNETSRKVDIDKVSEYIENKFQIRTIFGIKEETIEVYQNGVWSVKGKGIIKAEIERLLKVYAKNYVVNEILEKIKRRTEITREETENIPDYKRCLENGVLDFENVDDIRLLEFSREYNFRTKWNITYNPDAKCPKFLKLINEALYEEDILRFQEWVGFHLVRPYLFKKFAIFYGAKDTSKSLLINWLTKFLSENVSGLSLHIIAKEKAFDLLDLKDKDANISDELSSNDMSATGGIKMSVGYGYINAEQKFGDRLKIRNTAKHTFACNKIPSPKKDIDDEAYYDRILLFPFDNVIPKKQQDQKLLEKITTPEELSGALNWAIEGYKRLIKQNGFSCEKDPEEVKFLMIKGGNSLAEFSSEALEESDGAKITKEKLYNVYCDWCKNHKPQLSPDSKRKIGNNLIRFNPYIQSSKSDDVRYWLNVKFRDIRDVTKNNMSKLIGVDNIEEIDSKNNIYNNFGCVPSVPIHCIFCKSSNCVEYPDQIVCFDCKKKFKILKGGLNNVKT